jgi:hypothetical protein
LGLGAVSYGAQRGPLNEPPQKRLQLQVRFDSEVPYWDMKGDSKEASQVIGGVHIDQIGLANGVIEFDGERYELENGYAIRDHSRGIRDMSYFGAHAWINGSFPGGRHFYTYAMSLQGSQSIGMSNAAMVDSGRIYPATLEHVELLRDTRGAAQPHRLVLRSEIGTMDIEITAYINTFPYSMVSPFDTTPGLTNHRSTASMYDEFARLRCNGLDGVGWSERGLAPQPL